MLVYHLLRMWAPGWTNVWAQWMCFLLRSVFLFQSGSSWKSSREKARVMFAPLSVYKAQSYSVSSLPTPKVWEHIHPQLSKQYQPWFISFVPSFTWVNLSAPSVEQTATTTSITMIRFCTSLLQIGKCLEVHFSMPDG